MTDVRFEKQNFPLVIELCNTSIKDFENIEILKVGGNNQNNFGLSKEVSVSVENFDLTYVEVLDYLQKGKIDIEKTYVQCSCTSQLFQLMQVTGPKKTTLFPSLDQEIWTVMVYKHEKFSLDKQTSL